MDRRKFLFMASGVGATAVAYQASVFLLSINSPKLIEDDYLFQFLTKKDRRLLSAMIPVILDTSMPVRVLQEPPKQKEKDMGGKQKPPANPFQSPLINKKLSNIEVTMLQKFLKEILRRWDKAVTHLSPDIQDEVRKLFDTINGHYAYRFILKTPMNFNDAQAVDTFLREWKETLNDQIVKNDLRNAYVILTSLSNAIWYGMEGSWRVTGYEGPPLNI
jgi:hypothetical protein